MGNKQKGSNYERELCGRLSLWWTDGGDDDVFWRTAGSGARSTNRSRRHGKKTFGQAGDIQATNPIGQPLIDRYTIEIKRGYKDAHVGNEIDRPRKSKPAPLEVFVKQAADSANQAGTPHWLIIHRRDRREDLIYLPDSVPNKVVQRILRKSENFLILRTPSLRLYSGVIYCCKLESFLRHVAPEYLLLES